MLATDPQRCLETPPRTWRRRRHLVVGKKATGNTSTDVEKTGRPQLHLHGHAETPPRTWRRQNSCLVQLQDLRNTSTDVEKTRRCLHSEARRRKHLHGRGEDQISFVVMCFVPETPPRTWRRLGQGHLGVLVPRNTSTDVEKTSSDPLCAEVGQKHLHGRGEDLNGNETDNPSVETPPRTWRRPKQFVELPRTSRNTSTDVEKTLPSFAA